MMLTALNATDGAVLDVTDMAPQQVYELNGKRIARRHGYDLICKGCHRPAHLVRNHHGHLFFRHDPGLGSCILNELTRHGGESEEHINAKLVLVEALRSLSHWHVEPEQRHDDNGETIIIDVAAHYGDEPSHDAQGDFAWEVQLSPQTSGEFHERTNTIRRVSGHQPRWLTPHRIAVGELPAIICDRTAQVINDRLMWSYEPRIELPPAPVPTIVKSIHKRNRGHRWFPMLDHSTDTRPYYVVSEDAFRNGRRPRNERRNPTESGTDTPCTRQAFVPVEIDMPHLGAGEHICSACGIEVDAPWGFSFDPPLCKECFQRRQDRYLSRQ